MALMPPSGPGAAWFDRETSPGAPFPEEDDTPWQAGGRNSAIEPLGSRSALGVFSSGLIGGPAEDLAIAGVVVAVYDPPSTFCGGGGKGIAPLLAAASGYGDACDDCAGTGGGGPPGGGGGGAFLLTGSSGNGSNAASI